MEILIFLFVLFIVGFAIYYFAKPSLNDWDVFGILICTSSVSFLIVCVITKTMSRLFVKEEIIKFESVRQSILNARERGESLENASIQLSIIERNQWLAKYKYWNKTIFDIWVLDEVDNLCEIK